MARSYYNPSTFGFTMVYDDETICVAYDYGNHWWVMVQICFGYHSNAKVFRSEDISNVNPYS